MNPNKPNTNASMLREFDKYVTGHTNAKKVLINTINRSVLRHYQKWILQLPKSEWVGLNKVLLIGQSGCGKTFLVESLQKIIDFPVLKIDATHLNPTGASGGLKPEKVKELIRNYAKELSVICRNLYPSVDGTIDRMVVFLDEADKLAQSWESSGNWNRHVQSNFLTLFEDSGEFSGVTWIFAGAFVGMDKQIKGTNIGFVNNETTVAKDNMDDQLIKYGLIPELVGRINNITTLDEFTNSDYRNILMNVLLPKKQNELLYFNHSMLHLTEEQIEDIIGKAVASGQGIRFLKRQLDKLTIEIEFDSENNKPSLELMLAKPDDDIYEYL